MANGKNIVSELQSLITVHVAGIGNIGTFDKRTGGESTAAPKKYRPGGMGDEVVVPSLHSYNDLTLTRGYDLDRDAALVGQLLTLAGRALVSVTEQALDIDRNPYGKARVWNGTLGNVNPGNADGESDAPRTWDFTVVAVSSSN